MEIFKGCFGKERRACLWGDCNIRYHEQALIRQIVSKDMSTLGQINGSKLLLKVDVPQSEAQTHRVVEIRAFPGDLWRSLWSLLPQIHSLSLTLTLDLDPPTTSRASSGGPGFLSRTHSHCSILERSGTTAPLHQSGEASTRSFPCLLCRFLLSYILQRIRNSYLNQALSSFVSWATQHQPWPFVVFSPLCWSFAGTWELQVAPPG